MQWWPFFSFMSHLLWYKKMPINDQIQVTLTVIVISVVFVFLMMYACGRVWTMSVIQMSWMLQIWQIGHLIWPPAFKTILFRNTAGKNLPALTMGEWQGKLQKDWGGKETVAWPQSLSSGCFLCHVLSLYTSTGLSWMEDKVFRQQETGRHMWNICYVCLMWQKTPRGLWDARS